MSYHTQQDLSVSIIGAGIAGLTLALAFHKHSIPVTVYESRPAPLNIGGAVMLSPNGLKILDALGLYQNLKSKGYSFRSLEYRNTEGALLESQEFGSEEKYGYDGLRIYRHVLIDELVAALKTRGVTVRYGAKFQQIVQDDPHGVKFSLGDGTVVSSSLLIGADGIHSTVRKHIYPDLETTFTGMAGITASVPASQVKIPAGYNLPVTIMSPKGAFVIAPQEVDGSELFIGKQQRVQEGDHPGWDREYVADKDSAIAFLKQGNGHLPEFVQGAVSHLNPDKVNKWPFFVVPKLNSWASPTRRVIIVGDSAHALPPSAGQGINQALEDGFMLALLVGRAVNRGLGMPADALEFWHSYRQERVNRVLELNKQVDMRRMGASDGEEKEDFDLGWLYRPDVEADVHRWLEQYSERD